MAAADSSSLQQFVEARYRALAPGKPTAVTIELLGVLEHQVEAIFSPELVLAELLQNADDAKADELSVKIIGEFLIISYNGKPFSEKDITKITGFANRRVVGKRAEEGTIGFKGIGVKSVFTITDFLTYFSGGQHGGESFENASWRFDKNAWGAEGRKTAGGGLDEEPRHPWQIIPIPTEKSFFPVEVQDEIKNSVCLILKPKKSDQVQAILEDFFSNPTTVLFLRHIKSIICGDRSFKVIDDGDDAKVKTVLVDGDRMLHYLKGEDSIVGPDLERALKELKDLELKSCPPKLLTAPKIDITFLRGIFKQDEKWRCKENFDGKIFCYLPTKIETDGLHINGDWLPDESREYLKENVWNVFLIGQIALARLRWIASVARDETFRDDIMRLLGEGSVSSMRKQLREEYAEKFRQGLAEIAFLPSAFDPDLLLTVDQALVDRTGFFQSFPEITKEMWPKVGQIVRYELRNIENLLRLYSRSERCKHEYSLGDLIADVPRIARLISTPAGNKKLLLFLKKVFGDSTNFGALPKMPFIMGDDGEFYAPEDLYIGGGVATTSELGDRSRYLHSEINDQEGLYVWLCEALGMKEMDRLGLVRGTVINLIKSGEVGSIELSQEIMQLLFEIYKSGLHERLDDREISILFKLPVLTAKHGLQPVGSCYFPCGYWRRDETIDDGMHVINVENYLGKKVTKKERGQWGKFAMWLQVKRNVEFQFEDSITQEDLMSRADITSASEYASTIYVGRASASNIEIKPLVFLPHIGNFFKSTSSLQFFLRQFIVQWREIKKYRNVHYINGRGDVKTGFKSYLWFYCTKYGAFKAHNKADKFYSNQLYWPGLVDVIGDVASCVSLPGDIVLDKEQAEFLGFVVRPAVAHLLAQIDFLRDRPACEFAETQGRFVRILQFITSMELTSDEVEEIEKWRKKKKSRLLAADGSWQPVKDLTIPGDQYSDLPSPHFIWPCLGDDAAKTKFNSLFTGADRVYKELIPVLTEPHLQRDSSLIKAVIDWLPLLILFLAKQQSIKADKKKLLREKLLSLLQLKIFTCKGIELAGSERKAYFWSEKNQLSYVGRWTNLGVKSQVCEALLRFLGITRFLDVANFQDLLTTHGDHYASSIDGFLADNGFVKEKYEELQRYQKEIEPEIKKQVAVLKEAASKKISSGAGPADVVIGLAGDLGELDLRGDEYVSDYGDDDDEISSKSSSGDEGDHIDQVLEDGTEASTREVDELKELVLPKKKKSRKPPRKKAATVPGDDETGAGGRPTRFRRSLDTKNTTDTGGGGEEYLYNMLRDGGLRALIKFFDKDFDFTNFDENDYEYEEEELGFYWRHKDTDQLFMRVHWPSKKKWEQEKALADTPYDLLIKAGFTERELYVEVKTSTVKATSFEFSLGEFKEMEQRGDDYVLAIIDLREQDDKKEFFFRGFILNPFQIYQRGEIDIKVRKLVLTLGCGGETGSHLGIPGCLFRPPLPTLDESGGVIVRSELAFGDSKGKGRASLPPPK